jgi:LmbE family N-acetylglucosaminyl deacetylase
MESNNEKKILVVLAHPDDETFGMGGTLALYARRGVKVYLVCATRGEVGEVDADYLKDLILSLTGAKANCAARRDCWG